MDRTRATSFARFVKALEQLGRTSSSSTMVRILASLFADLKLEDARPAAYLLQGKLAPDYADIESGMGEKLVMTAIATSAGKPLTAIAREFRHAGDLGDVAARHAARRASKGLKLSEVFARLRVIAAVKGPASQGTKLQLLANLLRECSPGEAKYVVRLVLSTLRLGVAEMTVLSGLSEALTGSKAAKPILENAFNILSDLGEVVERALRSGIESLKRVRPAVGRPLRMMLAERVKDLAEIHEHIPGTLHVEYKYDGERVQAHIFRDGRIILYSRRQEDITSQYPEIAAALLATFRRRAVITEGELVAFSPKTGKLKDFQTLMQRRRKREVERYVAKVPVKCFLFDLLYLDGRSLLQQSLARRKEALRRSVRPNDRVECADFIVTQDVAVMRKFFTDVTEQGAEGVMIKDALGRYEAGIRGWHWIKYKKEYCTGLADTFDLVVVGGTFGRGLRAGQLGSLLVAVFNPQRNRFETFTKVGAGFSEAELARLPKRLKSYELPKKHRLVEARVKADVWFKPVRVMEVTGAQLTVSPVHTVAQDRVGKGGLALRFPRFLRWRDDKSAEQATTAQEIYQLYARTATQAQRAKRARRLHA